MNTRRQNNMFFKLTVLSLMAMLSYAAYFLWQGGLPQLLAHDLVEWWRQKSDPVPDPIGDDDARIQVIDDDAGAASRARVIDGLPGVVLSVLEQQQTGLQTLLLTPALHENISLAFAQVVDLTPLTAARTQMNRLGAEAAAIAARLSAARVSAAKMQQLNQQPGSVSARQVHELQAQIAADQAMLAGQQQRQQDLRAETLQTWGDALAPLAWSEQPAVVGANLDEFIRKQQVLLVVTFKPGESLPENVRRIRITPASESRSSREAQYIAAAYATDAITQGATYYFRTAGADLRIGMRIDALIPSGAGQRNGVEVPGSAVIWYADSLWVYKQVAADQFVRINLPQHEETADGWFIPDVLAAGDRIVTRGAQMLFSEEFRSAIPSEDEGRE